MYSTVHRKLFLSLAATLRLGGHTHKKTAKIMGIKTTQIKAHLDKARHALGHVWYNKTPPKANSILIEESTITEYRRHILP